MIWSTFAVIDELLESLKTMAVIYTTISAVIFELNDIRVLCIRASSQFVDKCKMVV